MCIRDRKKINEENKEVTINQKSNMSNIHQSLYLSKEKSEDLTYFVEDDYIHSLDSIKLADALQKSELELNKKISYFIQISSISGLSGV